MSASPLPPLDPLGLDAPFAEGMDEADRFEAMPAWNALGESPYAESPYAESEDEEPEAMGPADENLAWLDTEREREDPQAFAEDLALGQEGGELEDESQFEQSEEESEYFDDEERDAQEASEAYAPQDES
jgi:hypothetical protein